MVNSYSEVKGSYDLVLNDYGPNEMIGYINIQNCGFEVKIEQKLG
jgi:hypothetical protein